MDFVGGVWPHGAGDTEAARVFLDMNTDQWKNGTAFNYAVFTTAGELIGSCGLMTRMGAGTLEIGYWIHSAYAGRGYATKAATALARLGLSMPGIERVAINHDAANPASGVVAGGERHPYVLMLHCKRAARRRLRWYFSAERCSAFPWWLRWRWPAASGRSARRR